MSRHDSRLASQKLKKKRKKPYFYFNNNQLTNMIQAIDLNDETQKTARREQLTALFGKFPIQGIDFKKQLLEYSQGIFLFKGKEYISGGIIFMKPSPPTRASKNPMPNKLVITFQRKTHATAINQGGEGFTTSEINLSTTQHFRL